MTQEQMIHSYDRQLNFKEREIQALREALNTASQLAESLKFQLSIAQKELETAREVIGEFDRMHNIKTASPALNNIN